MVNRFNGQRVKLPGRILKPGSLRGKHLYVNLRNDGGKRRTRYVHQLVLEAFVGPRPEGQEVRHLNDEPKDNRLVNLAYGTASANMHDRVRNGIHTNAAKTHCKFGHPYAGKNIGPNGENGRLCIACSRTRAHLQRFPEHRHKYQEISDQYLSEILAQ